MDVGISCLNIAANSVDIVTTLLLTISYWIHIRVEIFRTNCVYYHDILLTRILDVSSKIRRMLEVFVQKIHSHS